MAARTKGWAQIRLSASAGTLFGSLGASLDTSVTVDAPGGGSIPQATDRGDGFVFLVAGTAYNVKWGGYDQFASFYAWSAANTDVCRCDVMYETTQTSIASDTVTHVGGPPSSAFNRTFSFTPTLTGTYRLKVNQITTVTVGGAAVSNDNTDNGNFGSAAPARVAGVTLLDFTPGLIAVGTGLSAPTHTPSGNAFATAPRTTVASQYPFSVGSQGTDASETCTVSRRDAADVQFLARTIAPTTAATKADPGILINNAVPIAATSVTEHLSFGNSALSTALGGAGIPWMFISGTLPSGWTAVTSNAVGATEIKASGLYTIDPRTAFTQLLQTDDAVFGTPPLSKNISPARFAATAVPELAYRIANKAGTQLNGIVWTESVWDNGNITGSSGSPTVSRTATSQTQGGDIGWSDALLTFSNPKPAGIWNHRAVITTADLVGTEDGSNLQTVTMTARNPDFTVVPAAGGSLAAGVLRHFAPGDAWIGGGVLINFQTGLPVAVDTSPAPFAFIGRFNLVLGRAEYLDSDYTWKAFTGSAGAYKWPLAASAGDANAYILQITGANTAGWTYAPQCVPVLYNNGTAYGLPTGTVLTGPNHLHDRQGLEWAGVPP